MSRASRITLIERNPWPGQQLPSAEAIWLSGFADTSDATPVVRTVALLSQFARHGSFRCIQSQIGTSFHLRQPTPALALLSQIELPKSERIDDPATPSYVDPYYLIALRENHPRRAARVGQDVQSQEISATALRASARSGAARSFSARAFAITDSRTSVSSFLVSLRATCEDDGGMASRKQEIYCEMLHTALVHIRNVQTTPWHRKARDRSCYLEAELVHNLTVSLLEPEFTDHDIWFLNWHARWYIEHCNSDLSLFYTQHVERIAELFALVPERLRPQLQWAGPSCS